MLLPPLGSSPEGNVCEVPGFIIQLPSTLQRFLLVPVLSLHSTFFRLAGIKSANNLPLGFCANGPKLHPKLALDSCDDAAALVENADSGLLYA